MARVPALVGVAVCCLAVLLGCKTAEFSGVLALNQTASTQTFQGALDVVALDTVNKLEKLKIKVDPSMQDEKGSTYYLNCQTAAGVRFKLILSREGSGATEKTNMRLEWIDPRDSSFGLHLLVEATAQKSP